MPSTPHTHFYCCKPGIPKVTNKCGHCKSKLDFGKEFICCSDCSVPTIMERRQGPWKHGEVADAECAPHREHLPVRACPGNSGAFSPSLPPGRAWIRHQSLRPRENHAWRRHGPARSSIDSWLFLGHSLRSPRSFPASSGSLQEVTRLENECYKKGRYVEALRHNECAVALCPESAACRSNQAAALIGLGRLADVLRECEEAVRLDPVSGRAHSRVAGFCLRLAMIDKARRHFTQAGHLQQSDPAKWQKLQEVEVHLGRCTDARKIGDWKNMPREADAAIAAGADSSQLLLALRSEALLRLHKLEEAESTLASMLELDGALPSSLEAAKLSGMLAESYVHIVRAQVDMALGRFDTAVAAAEKARDLDPGNAEIRVVLNNVRLVAKAREQGNDLFKAAKFSDASMAYGEGLKYDPSNSVLHCNRAACWSKLEKWEKAVDDCNEALRIQPNYTKALLRRAASYAKCWVDCVRDYAVLGKELPSDKEVAEALFHAQIALKATRGEDVSNMKFGGEIEK